MKAFAETGRSDVLEEQSQGEGGIYDEFNAPPITTGVGRTEAEFFVDGNHSRVNFKVAFLSDSSPPEKNRVGARRYAGCLHCFEEHLLCLEELLGVE